jgi:hypothetical protein
MSAVLAMGRLPFGIVNSCKTKEFEDGNAVGIWDRVKKKPDPVSATSLVKKMFREVG